MGDVKSLGVEHIAPAALPPHAVEVEQALLGSCLTFPQVLAEVADLLAPKAFYVAAHVHLWAAVSGMYSQRLPVDTVTVMQELKRRGTLDSVGGVVYLSQLQNHASGTANAVYCAHLILQCFIGREAIRIGNSLVEGGYHPGTDVFDLLSGASSEIRLLNEFGVKEARTMAEAVGDAVNDKSTDRSVPFGFKAIDDHLRIESAAVTIIGARPGMGKTAFMLSSSWRQAQAGYRPYTVEMEMKDRNLGRRLACGETGLSVWKAKHKKLTEHEEGILAKWHIDNGETLSRMIVNEASTLKVSALAAHLDRAKRKDGIDVVWIDYIGLLQPSEKKTSAYDRMTAISNELRILSKDLDLPFVALAQLSRPPKGASVTHPKLTDLRDSGEVEQDAEAVAFLHRPKYYDASADNTVEFISAKNRDGDSRMDELWFDPNGIRITDKSVFDNSPAYNPRAGMPTPNQVSDEAPF